MCGRRRHYVDVVRPSIEQFGYTNPMQVPRLEKIVLNMGIGEATADSKLVQVAVGGSRKDCGSEGGHHQGAQGDRDLQDPREPGYWRQGHAAQDTDVRVLDRLVTIALPRVRDFRGLSDRSFDGHGNYAMGIKEHIIFPEIDYDKIDRVWGMDVIICTTANTDDEARALLEAFNFPVPPARAQAGGIDRITR